MCCFWLVLVFIGPRIALLVLWLYPFWRLVTLTAFGNWILPILGLLFLPWLTLVYILVYPVFGVLDWLLLGVALLADLSTYGGGARRSRYGGWGRR